MNLLTQFTDQYIYVSQKKESQHAATCSLSEKMIIHKTNMLESTIPNQIHFIKPNVMFLTDRAYVMYVFFSQ